MLREALCEVLEQVTVLIECSRPIYNSNLQHNHQLSSLSPIGKHVRHIIDHCWAFQMGVRTGTVDYNLRHRNTDLETSDQLACEALASFSHWLKTCDFSGIAVQVINEVSTSRQESVALQTTLDRELLYVINHALHHIAYAALLARINGIDTPNYLGVAPATASYLREGA